MTQYAQFDPSQPAPFPVIGWYDTDLFAYPALPPADRLYQVTPTQWQAHLAEPSGWAVDGGRLVQVAMVVPPVPAALQAQAALDASDRVMLRCWEHGVAPPAEWVAYRVALRAVASGASTTMPTRPTYPDGT